MGLFLACLAVVFFLMAAFGMGSVGPMATAPLGAALYVLAWLCGASLPSVLTRVER